MNHFLYHSNLTTHQASYRKVYSQWSKDNFAYPHNRLYYDTDGEDKIELKDRCIYLKKGYLYLLPAFMMVKTICDDFLCLHYIHFQLESLEFTTYLSYCLTNFYSHCKHPDQIILLFESVQAHYSKTDISNHLATQGALQLLLASFFRANNIEKTNIQRFTPVLEYINSHLSEAIDLQTLADLLSIEKIYFSNLFAKTFGIPPRQYINKCRLNHAQLLLINTSKKVKEIALEVGFENDMYFSRLFKSKFNMTPGTYRKSI